MTGFGIFYNAECVGCGTPVDDPFWDELCFQCDHNRHAVAPWAAPDCPICHPYEDDRYEDES